MKKIVLLIPILILGCTGTRYPNWEYVRIEHNIPSKECEYKIQEACSRPGAGCYNYYKQRATVFGANTVVLTDTSKDISASSKAVAYNGSGGASSEINTNLTALADYYYCPK